MAFVFNPKSCIGPEIEGCFQRIIGQVESLTKLMCCRMEIVKILHHPQLRFLDHYRFSMAESLEQAGLITDAGQFNSYIAGITQLQEPGSFISAPGSRMRDHHSYPGGLVYHTVTDIELALSIAAVYQQVYRAAIEPEILIAALALHDIAKVTVFPWNESGEYPDEFMVAGTEGHHIFSISEAIYRGLPRPVIQAIAFCHNRSIPPEKGLQDFLIAAGILAGKEYSTAYIPQITLADWICLYADSDWLISSWAMRRSLERGNGDQGELYQWLSRNSEFAVFQGDK